MPTRKPASTTGKGEAKPNNPFGMTDEAWGRLMQERSRCVGKCIAWSPDHEGLLAVGATHEEVDGELDRLGLASSAVIREFVEPYLYATFARDSG